MGYLFPNFYYGPVITALLVSGLAGLIAYVTVFRTRWFDGLIKQPLVSNFLAVPCTMLALIIAFMASSVWQNGTVAKTALWNEKMAIETISGLLLQPAELKRAVENHLAEYVSLVTNVEWGTHRNQHRMVEVDTALRNLTADAWALEATHCNNKVPAGSCSSSVMTTTLMRALEQMRLAREQRLSLGSQANLGYLAKWFAVYLLATVAAINLAAGHRAAKHAAAIALTIFCTCTAILCSMVALSIHPYKGPDALHASMIAH
jgi:hypothetical protein